MANAAQRFSWQGRAFFLATGLLVLCGLLAGSLTPERAAAQAKTEQKKTDPPFTEVPGKGDPKKGDPKKGDPEPPVKTYDSANLNVQVAYINDQIEAKWKANKIEPAPRCSDFEFIRRASLDIIGRIAKPSEVAKFMSWPEKTRRAQLIDELLADDEYAQNFANIFANLLMTRTGSKLHHEQMQVWLMDEFDKKNCDWSKLVTSLLAASGITNGKNDEPAVNFILAHMGDQLPPDNKNQSEPFATNGKFEMVPVTSRITRLFLSLRTQCTQCHDHPFNDEWRQEHFWGINAFLRQVDAPDGRPTINGKKKGMAKDMQYRLLDNPAFNKKGLVAYERRSGAIEVTKVSFLDGSRLPEKMEGTRRQELAKFVTKSPFFAKSFVNRTWGHFFGRGFTKDVDDFGDHSPISHPDLLEKLAKDWIAAGHNPRTLIRWICNSKAYSLSSITNKTNDKNDAEPFFSRMLLKAMTPEQLFESLMTATESKDSRSAESKRKMREDWLNKLVVNFGDDEGNEGSFNGTVVQALMLMNGDEINKAIMDKEFGTVAAVMKHWSGTVKSVGPRKALQNAIFDLYMAAMNRHPSDVVKLDKKTGEKYSELSKLMMKDRMKLKKDNVTEAEFTQMLSQHAFVEAYCQDLMWAMLNSNEFILNH